MSKLNNILGDPPYLYFIADSSYGMNNLPYLSEQAAKGGTQLVQLRAKDASEQQIIAATEAIQQKITPYNALLLINDMPQISQKNYCNGVHLGQEDISPIEARTILGKEAIIGLTIHSYEEALNAPYECIDYVGLGAMFPSMSKLMQDVMDFDQLQKITQHIRKESDCAIFGVGGINQDNMDQLQQYDIDGIAIIAAISKADDPAAISSEIKRKLSNWK